MAGGDQQPGSLADRLPLLRPHPADAHHVSLAAVAPHLAAQWHPIRNRDVSPTDVLPRSNTPVWWQCPDHHDWAATPADRLGGTGTGCPDCAARNRPPIRRPLAGSSP